MNTITRHHLAVYASAAFVVLVTLLIYWPGLAGPFVFDDATSIVQNPAVHITSLSRKELIAAARSSETGPLGRPIAMLSFALNYYFTQLDPSYFKLTNVLIHLLTGLGLFLLSRQLLRHHRFAEGSSRRANWLGLAVVAAWLLHPLNLASVLYVVQRMASLAAMFTVFGLLTYVHGRQQIVAGRKRGFVLIAVGMLLFGFLAVFSKETGVLLPLYAAVIELVIYRFAAHDRLQAAFKRFWYSIIAIPLLLVAGLALVKTGHLLYLDAYSTRDFSLGERLLTQSRAIWFYLSQIVLPDIGQMGVYHDDFPVSRGLLEPASTLFSVLGVLGLALTAVLVRRPLPVLSFGIAWFFAGHVLESTVLPLLLVQEHRNYLASFGILLAIAYYLTYPSPRLSGSLKVRYGFLALFIALLASGTVARSQHWKDAWTLYNTDVRNHPNSAYAHTMLGIILHDSGHYDAAATHFQAAAVLAPEKPETVIRLAQHMLVAQGAVPDALLDELDARLQKYKYSTVTLWVFEPLLSDAKRNPALNARITEIYERMVALDNRAVNDKWRGRMFSVLGDKHLELGDPLRAAVYLEKAIAADPKPRYYLALASVYATLDNIDRVRELLESLSEMRESMSEEEAFMMEKMDDAAKRAHTGQI